MALSHSLDLPRNIADIMSLVALWIEYNFNGERELGEAIFRDIKIVNGIY